MSDYLSEIVNENFQREIYSGHITAADIRVLAENGQLTDEQLRIIEEAGLRSALAGFRGAAGAVGTGLKAGAQSAKQFGQNLAQKVGNVGSNLAAKAQQGAQNIKNAYTQGRNTQDQKNALKAFQTNWNSNTSRMFEALLKAFPNNPDVAKAVTSIQEWAGYTEQLMTKAINGGAQQQPVQQQPVQQQPVQQQPQDNSRFAPPANMVRPSSSVQRAAKANQLSPKELAARQRMGNY